MDYRVRGNDPSSLKYLWHKLRRGRLWVGAFAGNCTIHVCVGGADSPHRQAKSSL